MTPPRTDEERAYVAACIAHREAMWAEQAASDAIYEARGCRWADRTPGNATRRAATQRRLHQLADYAMQQHQRDVLNA